eukprot:5383110-Amphidinium_carterae.2
MTGASQKGLQLAELVGGDSARLLLRERGELSTSMHSSSLLMLWRSARWLSNGERFGLPPTTYSSLLS